MLSKLPYFLLFTILISLLTSCSNPTESKKQQLLSQGIEQSAKYSEEFLNFYYENNIERSEAEYPEYYAEVAKKMRKIWKIYSPFDEIIGDSVKASNLNEKEIYIVYKTSLDSLNLLLSENDTLYNILEFNSQLDKKTSLNLYKNHLENTKNKFLRKLIKTQPQQIQKKNYYAFQVIETSVNQINTETELYFSYTTNQPPYTNEILIDSIVNESVKCKTSFSIDSSLIFGKINIKTNKKGNHFIYGKVKISGQNGFSLIPFKEKFEIY